ncbi:hypothetical protein WJX84_005067 [Apatococcus fuscideae]|uniref:DNA polymerase delta subunit 4 n=1 Tax=Apatococcus fuscideae TaxID=2026836 RepID=A0AAW1SYQ0_9CHLO
MQGGLCGPPRRGQRWVTWCKQNNRSPAPATIPPRFAFRELAAETVVLLHYCDSCGYRPWAKQFSANLKPQLPKGTVIQELSTVHEDEDEECLRQFDLTSKFGPCTGMTRMERWTRAEEMGLSPPSSVKDILLRLDGGSSLQHDLWHDRV